VTDTVTRPGKPPRTLRRSKAEHDAICVLANAAAKRLKVKGDFEFEVRVRLRKPGNKLWRNA
jgi:hypothetical protein